MKCRRCKQETEIGDAYLLPVLTRDTPDSIPQQECLCSECHAREYREYVEKFPNVVDPRD